MAITIEQFAALDFGYLTGDDLLDRCPGALLINQYTAREASIAKGVAEAMGEMAAACTNRYDIATEFNKRADQRAIVCVKLTAGLAVINCLGSAQSIGEKMLHDFSLVNKNLLALRNGQYPLPLHPPPTQVDTVTGKNLPDTKSTSALVCSSFKTLG